MFGLKRLRGLLTVLALVGTLGDARAALDPLDPTVEGSIIDAAAGTVAAPTFYLGFPANYNLKEFSFTLAYDPAQVTFNAGTTTVTYGGVTKTLAETAALLQDASNMGGLGLSFNSVLGVAGNLQTYTFSGLFNTGTLGVAGLVQWNPAFLVNSTVPTGSSIQIGLTGNVFKEVSGASVGTALSSASFINTVSAVPEPSHWLMLACGLAMMSAVAGRRGQRRPGSVSA